jgi:methylmalonyl-CoA mutase N-terminal domain/subunit
MKERFQAKDPKSYLFRIFAGSCGSTLMSQQPVNNIVRVAMHALIGILAGNQAIHTACWDEAYALPSEESATIALRTQQILAYECGLCNTIDPLAGSYYLESLTNEIEKKAEECLGKIDGMGGMLGAIDNGFVFREIQESSVRFQERVYNGERIIVGLNKFAAPDEKGMEEHNLLEIDSQVEEVQKKKLAATKSSRKGNEVKNALSELGNAIEKNENLMPHLINAVKCYATIGEICGVMRQKWGEFRGPTYI